MSFFLAYKLRRASDTVAIEKKRDELRSNFEEFEKFSKSDELQHFNELETYVLSDEFKKNRKSIERKSFKKSQLFQDEKQFKRFHKSRKFKTYFKLKDSSELTNYNQLSESDELRQFKDLETLVKSSSFNKKKQADELNKYKKLKSSAQIKEYFKFRKSKALRIYQEIKKSADLKNYYQLEEKISSDNFLKEKEFLQDKKRFEKTEEYKKLQEYQKLKTSEKFVKFFKLKHKNPFNEIKKWELTFADEFDTNKLDTTKWTTRYFWGDKLLNKAYSLAGDLQSFTDGNNIQVSGTSAVLQARKEKKESLLWRPDLGFVPQQFEYTSAIINTGNSFSQKYGKFEAKIKLKNPSQVQNSFWMISDKILPHINVMKTANEGKLLFGNFWGNEKAPQKNEFKVKGIDLSKGYFIYTLNWSADKLEWKINNVSVKIINEGIPKESMYLNFCIAVKKASNNLNSELEIDWVRCYQMKN